jgi:hypothetical protein
MLKLSTILRQIERRARYLHGLTSASFGFALGSILGLIAAGLCRFELLPLRWPLANSVLVIPPVALGLLFYCLGYTRSINLPRLLLKVDHALQTEERLSSLYELRQRGRGKVFRDQIERQLEKRSFLWQKGLRLNWRRFTPFALGGTLLMGFALLTILPTPASPPPTELDAASLLSNETAYSSPPISSNALQNPPRETSSSAPSSLQEGGLPIQRLEDPLSEIWNTPSEGSLLEESVDLNELMEEQRRLSEQLSELLSQIKERLEQQKQAQGEGGLTQAERQALMAMLPQIAQSEIQETLESLLEETDPEALEDYLEQAQNLTRGWVPSPEGSEDEEPSPTEQEGEGQQEETQTAWEMMEQEGEDTPEEQNTAPIDRQQRSSESEEEDWKLGEDDRSGGETSSENEEEGIPQENLLGFERQELAGSIGSQGEFQDFITKGVPLEPGPRDEGVDAPLFVNYETMRAILEERAIPADAREAIRKYFQLITQGET